MGTSTNSELVDRWAHLFNSDVEKLVTELYSPECRFNGAPMNHDKLIRFEKRVLATAPNRTMRVERAHDIDGGVAVEGTLLDPDKGADWALTFCAVLTVADRKIVNDNTYADFSRWPGMG